MTPDWTLGIPWHSAYQSKAVPLKKVSLQSKEDNLR